MTPAFILAAPSSHSGKTSVTLGLLRAFSRQAGGGPAPKGPPEGPPEKSPEQAAEQESSRPRVRSAKIGPDYIDPAFHQAACGHASLTLDPWAMPAARLEQQVGLLRQTSELVLIESAMGLFDGAADGSASTASLAKRLGVPVILVVDCSGMAGSIAALVHGFNSFDPGLNLAGLILNKVASERHGALLADALAPLGLPILAKLARRPALDLPSRHLGLVQAGDTPELEAKLEAVADWVGEAGLPDALLVLAAGGSDQSAKGRDSTARLASPHHPAVALPTLGRHIAVARDAAFSFVYPHLLDDWRQQGAQVSFVSPLANQPLPAGVDALYLPGGYPELHAQALSGAETFWTSLHQLVAQGGCVYGECGGYMALGQTLIDGQGCAWPMAGLLDQTTRFDRPQRHLGYRAMQLAGNCALGRSGARFRGHEFHYSVQEPLGQEIEPLWDCRDARGQALGLAGQIKGRVLGSYLHLVDSQP